MTSNFKLYCLMAYNITIYSYTNLYYGRVLKIMNKFTLLYKVDTGKIRIHNFLSLGFELNKLSYHIIILDGIIINDYCSDCYKK